MLRNLLMVVACLFFLAPFAFAQDGDAAAPGGGATNVETTAPGGKKEVTLEFNNKVTEPEEVWVDGRKLEGNEWEWEAPGTSGKKLKITFKVAPPEGKKVEVRVRYPGAKPELTDAKWN